MPVNLAQACSTGEVDLSQPCSTGEVDLSWPCSTGEVDLAQACPTNKLCSTDQVDWSEPLLSGEADNKEIAVSQDVDTYVCRYSISDESVTFDDKYTVHQERGHTGSIYCDSLHNENLGVEVGCSSTKTNALELTGRRFVDINYLLNTIRKLDYHGPFSRKFSDMFVFREVRLGLRSVVSFKCRMYNLVSSVSTDSEDTDEMSVNKAAAVGCVASGSGFSVLAELTSAMNIPSMTTKAFSRYQDKVFDCFERTALEEMKRAAEEEAKLAVEHG
ncbi:hypothetical protein PR048_010086 [Dryococelus australis]|uniref:Mutator-like transposase domain-containing protein n=1 Tax=Dryococelus australis TaxID=614101 RepID=A0ABQ9I1U5_9NEOP|nr:hypothetical protein PR048_010086 [Dryococelus australis]